MPTALEALAAVTSKFNSRSKSIVDGTVKVAPSKVTVVAVPSTLCVSASTSLVPVSCELVSTSSNWMLPVRGWELVASVTTLPMSSIKLPPLAGRAVITGASFVPSMVTTMSRETVASPSVTLTS